MLDQTVQILRSWGNTKGNILLLMPGAKEVRDMEEKLNNEIEKFGLSSVLVSAFHSGVMEDQRRSMIAQYNQRTKAQAGVLIMTNIGATSLTLPHLRVVIDSMLTRRVTVDPYTGNIMVETDYVTNDEYVQRRGRVGRTQPGQYYAMMTKNEIDNLVKSPQSQVEYLPLHKVCLRLLKHDINPNNIFVSPDDFNRTDLTDRVDRTLDDLLELKLIKDRVEWNESSPDYELTKAGHLALLLPFSVNNSAFLWQWMKAKHPIYPGLILTALIDNYGPYWNLPSRAKYTDDSLGYQRAIANIISRYTDPSTNDLEVQLYIWQDLMESCMHMLAYLTPTPLAEQDNDWREQQKAEINALRRWERQRSMDQRKIRELLFSVKLASQVINIYFTKRRRSKVFVIGRFNVSRVMKAARPILAQVYASRLMKKEGNSLLYNWKNRMYKLDQWSLLKATYPTELIALISFQTVSRRNQNLSFIRLAIEPTQPSGPTEPLTRVILDALSFQPPAARVKKV
ncbi:hypothetical protein KDA11_01395, partial [Candidatus Saccharibacteria bacterium]|nr:hypothetical protein [Candidatus Saccharibacteria bacterium]